MRERIACIPVSHVVAPVVLLVSLLGAAASAQQGPAFEGRYFATSNFPQRIACGDFTGDGRPDVASADGNGSLVALSVGNGAGGFAPAAILSVSNSSPVAMELVDIDGNGSLDLVLAYTKSIIAPPFTNFNYVEIRLNNGAGVFAAASILSLANFTGASGIAVGDLNGDGLPDIAVSQSGVNTLSLLLGTAPGAFALPSNYSVGFPTADVSIGDANHDGLGDLAAASLQPNQIVAFALGTSGGPGVPTNLPMGATLSQVSLVDVSGDGRLDIVAAGLSAPGFLTRLGDGLGPSARLPTMRFPTKSSR